MITRRIRLNQGLGCAVHYPSFVFLVLSLAEGISAVRNIITLITMKTTTIRLSVGNMVVIKQWRSRNSGRSKVVPR